MGEDMVAVKITAKEVKIPQKGAAWSGPSCPRLPPRKPPLSPVFLGVQKIRMSPFWI